jgi:hypothetical protein
MHIKRIFCSYRDHSANPLLRLARIVHNDRVNDRDTENLRTDSPPLTWRIEAIIHVKRDATLKLATKLDMSRAGGVKPSVCFVAYLGRLFTDIVQSSRREITRRCSSELVIACYWQRVTEVVSSLVNMTNTSFWTGFTDFAKTEFSLTRSASDRNSSNERLAGEGSASPKSLLLVYS